MSANVLATINLKGGVGKTTTTVAMAEILAVDKRQRVLLIDLDPQTNATVMLIGEDRWRELNGHGQTLAQLFADALQDEPSESVFNLEKSLQRGVSPVAEVQSTHRLDLLPSSLDLIDIQDRLATMPVGRYYSKSPTEILHTALKGVIDDYDWILIDCPPNMGIITLNGLRIAHGYVIPTIPDVLSTYGIPQIVTRVADFGRELNETIEPLGIIVTKYRDQGNLHWNTLRGLRRDDRLPRVFDTVIPEATAIARSAEFAPIGTLRQKYEYGGRYEALRDITQEVADALAVPVSS